MKAFETGEFEKYKGEAKEKWGTTDAYREYRERTGSYSQNKWNELAGGMNELLAAFGECMKRGAGAESSEAQGLVKKLQDYITDNYYHCTKEILADLGQMYVADARFKNNIDKNGAGTAAFISAAIKTYCG